MADEGKYRTGAIKRRPAAASFLPLARKALRSDAGDAAARSIELPRSRETAPSPGAVSAPDTTSGAKPPSVPVEALQPQPAPPWRTAFLSTPKNHLDVVPEMLAVARQCTYVHTSHRLFSFLGTAP